MSTAVVEFVKKLLETDQDKRIKAVTALNDKWLLNITKARGGKQGGNPRALSQTVVPTFKLFIVSDLIKDL